jgi:hypothetical protein
MTRLLLSLLLLAAVLPAGASDWITATIHVSTNVPNGNTNSITINGDTRTFTNTPSSSPANLIQQTNTVEKTATNILNHLTAYPVTAGFYLSQTTSTNVTVRGLVGGAMVVTLDGFWGHVTYSTQTVQTPTIVVRVPVSNEAATNRVTIANGLSQAISDYATTPQATNAVAMSNYLSKGASVLQQILSTIQFNNNVGFARAQLTNGNFVNSTNEGYVVTFKNGMWTNGILNRPTTTNLVNRGEAISSPGTNGVGSEQFGTGARATNEAALAVGNAAVALGPFSTATGNDSSASGYGDSAFGYAAVVSGGNGVAIGAGSVVTGTNGAALGTLATVTHADSTAIGTGAESTETNQVVLGNATQTVSIPGVIVGPTQTNSTFRGTNVFNGRVDFTSRANSSLANGNNSGVILGTNTYVRLSGPSAAYVLNGIAAEQDGSWHIIEAENPVNSLTIAHQSGTDPTAGNRIVTGTGADVVLTNNPAIFEAIYNASAARWRLKGVWR